MDKIYRRNSQPLLRILFYKVLTLVKTELEI
jgi:hypothetical protein